MRRFLLALGLAAGLAIPLAAPVPAHAVSVNITVGSNVNRGRAITCSQGQRLLRNRGFRDVRRVDCRGRFFGYRARRGNHRVEVAIDSRNGRVVDVRRLRR